MSNPTNVTTTLRRQRGLTEEAAAAAVDQACRRLRLPTMRAVMHEAITAAERELSSVEFGRGFFYRVSSRTGWGFAAQ